VSDKTGWKGRGQQLRDSNWARRDRVPSPGPGQRKYLCVGVPKGIYSAGLLGAKTEIPDKLYMNDDVLLTPEGDEVAHASEEFIRHIISEFDVEGGLKISKRKVTEPRFFGCYALLGIQNAFIEHRKEEPIEIYSVFELELRYAYRNLASGR